MKRPPAELLTAYFDGEVSAAERAQAERLLQEDASAAKWLEDCGELRTLVQALPRYSLEEDFCECVLHQAERAVLLSPAAAGANGRMREACEPPQATLLDGALSTCLAKNSTPRMAARAWHAPLWLAAAASLLLFAGLPWLAPPPSEGTIAFHHHEPHVAAGSADQRANKASPANPKQALPKQASAVAGGGHGAGPAGSGAPHAEAFSYFGVQTPQAPNGVTKDLGMAGPVVVVCDVPEPPAEAFARFEGWLRQQALSSEQLAADAAVVEDKAQLAGSEMLDLYKKDKGIATQDASAPRLYLMKVAETTLEDTLREAARFQQAEVSISSLNLPAPVAERLTTAWPAAAKSRTLEFAEAPGKDKAAPTTANVSVIFVLRAAPPGARTKSQ